MVLGFRRSFKECVNLTFTLAVREPQTFTCVCVCVRVLVFLRTARFAFVGRSMLAKFEDVYTYIYICSIYTYTS